MDEKYYEFSDEDVLPDFDTKHIDGELRHISLNILPTQHIHLNKEDVEFLLEQFNKPRNSDQFELKVTK